MKNKFLSLFVFLLTFLNVSAQIKVIKNTVKVPEQPIGEQKIDSLVQKTMETFDVPGISVGIIKDGNVVYAKGQGVRALNDGAAMNKNTLVGIASNSKGFTCTALAILADEGKLNWDDKVTKFIPEFEMYDDYLTQNMTIRDLVTHRTGLGLGQGDLMFFPEGGKLTVKDIVQRVKYLQPKSTFRNKLHYNNIMFIVAGEVITRITGKSWAAFIEENILKPVGMKNSYGSYHTAEKVGIANKIAPHAPADGQLVQVPHDWSETANAAGGIVSNIPDMLKWANCLMNDFTTEDGKKLVSDKQILQLWQIQQPITMRQPNDYNTHFYGYGLGWFLSDVEGYQQIQHTGGLIGTVTQFTLIPDLKLGIVVLTNQQSGAAFNTITNTIKDAYLELEERDWLKKYDDRMQNYFQHIQQEKEKVWSDAKTFEESGENLAADKILGTYTDLWFGDVKISKDGDVLRLVCENSPRLKGTLFPYSENTMIVKWDDRSYDADAFLIFTFNEKGKATKMAVKPISDITDFSFDFEDLDLNRK